MINLLSDCWGVPGRTKLNADFWRDLRWWQKFLPRLNETSSFLEASSSSSDVFQLYTDGLRFAGCFKAADPRIELLEMTPILCASALKNGALRCKKVLFHYDNFGAAQAWASLGSKCRNVLSVVTGILQAAAESNFTVTIKHLNGSDNVLADALTRF